MPETNPTIKELFDLTGQVALVTGGAGWLGTAMCEALAEAGARVIIGARHVDRCADLAKRLGPQHQAIELDIAKEAALRAAVGGIFDRHGSLDILVNNAYSGTGPKIDAATTDDFRLAYENGLIPYFVASQEMVKRLRDKGRGGSIINIGSMYGVVASYPDVYEGTGICSPPNYHALKGAVVHLTRHLAVYWAKNHVRVNCLSPGPFPSQTVKGKEEEFIRKLSKKVPMGRMGLPWELKGATLFLASKASSFVTGQNLLVDGGWTAW